MLHSYVYKVSFFNVFQIVCVRNNNNVKCFNVVNVNEVIQPMAFMSGPISTPSMIAHSLKRWDSIGKSVKVSLGPLGKI